MLPVVNNFHYSDNTVMKMKPRSKQRGVGKRGIGERRWTKIVLATRYDLRSDTLETETTARLNNRPRHKNKGKMPVGFVYLDAYNKRRRQAIQQRQIDEEGLPLPLWSRKL
jgi:hypothetical protein